MLIKELKDENIQHISSGYNHSACIIREGKVYVWGNNSNFELGIGKSFTDEIDYSPKKVNWKK